MAKKIEKIAVDAKYDENASKCVVFGRKFATFAFKSHELANEFMRENEGFGLISEEPDGMCHVARCTNKGTALTDDEIRERIKLQNLPVITLADYNNVHPDYRSVWSTERTDMPDWPEIRERYMGKRTLMRNGALEIEGLSFLIQD